MIDIQLFFHLPLLFLLDPLVGSFNIYLIHYCIAKHLYIFGTLDSIDVVSH